MLILYKIIGCSIIIIQQPVPFVFTLSIEKFKTTWNLNYST